MGQHYWNLAHETHNYTNRVFLIGGVNPANNTPMLQPAKGAYRADTDPNGNFNSTSIWHNVSQMMADAAMVQRGDARFLDYMNATYDYSNHFWDFAPTGIGGYKAIVGLEDVITDATKYTDDNALAGVAYLEAAAVTDGTRHLQYLQSARDIANYLMFSHRWDTWFGGGFWWCGNEPCGSDEDKSPKKPTQSNGLAAQLFLRLYELPETTQPYYLLWGQSILKWLKNRLFDQNTNLYKWKVVKSYPQEPFFRWTYDQAIMIEALLIMERIATKERIAPEGDHLKEASAVADALIANLWDPRYRVFAMNDVPIFDQAPVFKSLGQVSPVYSSWATRALLLLYQVDPQEKWLHYAQANVEAINALLRRHDGGYNFYFANDHVGDNLQQAVDQSWMQQVMAMLSDYF